MRNAIFFGLWLLFYQFFWGEHLALNLFTFALAVQISLRYFHRNWTLKTDEIPYLLSFLLSGLGLVFINSSLSILVFIMVNFAYFSFNSGPRKSPMEHLFYAIIRVFNMMQPLLPSGLKKGPKGIEAVFSILRLAILPLGIFILFFLVFRAGNPIFKEWSDAFSQGFWEWFEDLSWDLIWFMILGFALLRSFFLQKRNWPSILDDAKFINKGRNRRRRRHFNMNGLHHEYRMAIMVFISLNLLLLVVNVIDIKWFWFGFEVPKQFSLKEFLHEGVAYLIISILMASAVVFIFFRNNLNFYPKAKSLRILARIWLIQNGILVISVCLRTVYYIDFHGLAYGRIVVISTLLVVSCGLFLLYRKVGLHHHSAFVFRRVSAFSMLLLAILSTMDWDQKISAYNLNNGRISEIDVDNYLRMHPRTYPLIYENLDIVEEQIKAHQSNTTRWIKYVSIEDFKETLDLNAQNFIEEREDLGFWSWNYADGKALEKLQRINP